MEECISAFGCIPVDPKREDFCWAEPKSPPPVVPVVVPICAEVEPNRPPPDVEMCLVLMFCVVPFLAIVSEAITGSNLMVVPFGAEAADEPEKSQFHLYFQLHIPV
ncbi:hypothetical protein WR25_04667 [Diploscapter pachys]|uniref:Uncharacterized protein n=1 Tax=Diploscapter pachys TaxID=2018661 RepID=A0A2A2M3M6_9BILA|nr:hypothetical protein WR25_04667 [Diploscapter pachys]